MSDDTPPSRWLAGERILLIHDVETWSPPGRSIRDMLSADTGMTMVFTAFLARLATIRQPVSARQTP